MKHDQFSECLLKLQYSEENTAFLTKFIADRFTKINFDDIGPTCLQLFEPDILTEISLLYKIKLESIENFDYEITDSESLNNLQWMLKNRKYLSSQQKINLAHSLNTLARYKLARSLLNDVNYAKLRNDWKLYYLFCDFCISNRLENDDSSEDIFEKVKGLMEMGEASNQMIVLFASQYIVWSLKTTKLANLFKFMLERAEKTVTEIEAEINEGISNTANLVLLSAWYRAMAMVPAKELDLKLTREYMEKAFDYAERIVPANIFEEYNKKNLIKTYYESAIKEFLYLHKNTDLALEAALKMIEIDKNWPISWQQLAEVCLARGDFKSALNSYEKAYELGSPRKIENLFYIGYCQGRLGQISEALDSFKEVLDIDNKNISAVISGYNLSLHHKFPSENKFFSNYLEKLYKDGFISAERFKDIKGDAVYA